MLTRTTPSGRAGTRSAQLAAELGRRIVGRVYLPESTLPPEAALLDEFGVSRTVLRDAVKALESKGLVEPRQRRGTCVNARARWNLLDADVLDWVTQSGADPQLLVRLTELRMIVEPGACLLAAGKADAAGLRRIEAAWTRMSASVDDAAAFVAADREFHTALLVAADNEYLASISTVIAAALAASPQRTGAAGRDNRASLPAHERIVAALRRRDGEAAAQASRAQLGEALRRLDRGPRAG